MGKVRVPHYVILNSSKVPMWPPRGGVSGEETYPIGHERAGRTVSRGHEWQKYPASEDAARNAHESGIVFAGVMPSSIGCLVVDIDTEHSLGVHVLKNAVIESLGEPAYWCKTPSGGEHLYYKCSGKIGNPPWEYLGERGGEIKSHRGYAILYDFDGFTSFLEYIEDHEPVELGVWPINKPAKSEMSSQSSLKGDPDSIKRFSDNEILDWLNKKANPDTNYNSWIRIGMGLHHEGYPFSVWESWSRGGSKFEEGNCQKHWSSFGNCSDPVTMATVVQEVNDNLLTKIQVSNRGELMTEEQAEESKEEQGEESDSGYFWGDTGGGGTDKAIREFCQSGNVPLEYSVSSYIDPDVARIIKFGCSRIVNVDGILYSEYNGLWRRIDPRDDKSKLSVSSIIRDSREEAVRRVRESGNKQLADVLGSSIMRSPMSDRIVREICSTVILHSDSASIKRIESFNPGAIPMLPLRDGTGINLSDAFDEFMEYKIVSSSDMMEMYIEDLNFSIRPPVKPWECPEEEKDNWNTADKIYRKGGRFYKVIRRMSLYALPGAPKRVDMLAAETNGGKSLLAMALTRALPGAFKKVSRKGFMSGNRSQGQFTPMHSLLNQHWGILIDELHDHKISASEVNVWGDETLVLHKKGVDPYVGNNNGTVMLLGDEVNLPQVDPAGQGFMSRFFWALDLRDEGKMTSHQYRAVKTDGGTACLLYYFIKYASMQLTGKTFDEAIEESDKEGAEDRRQFSSELQDEIVTLIADIYDISPIANKVSSGEIVQELEEVTKGMPGSIEVPDIRHVHSKVVAAFGNKAKRGRYKMDDGKRVSGYLNLRKRM